MSTESVQVRFNNLLNNSQPQEEEREESGKQHQNFRSRRQKTMADENLPLSGVHVWIKWPPAPVRTRRWPRDLDMAEGKVIPARPSRGWCLKAWPSQTNMNIPRRVAVLGVAIREPHHTTPPRQTHTTKPHMGRSH
ncbi:hypothetical protein E2C01_090756 [Portunus trituberculatus]|uniref:Uncharacterized protein n=1 Tax=Portunus trituberculatus TaxID=210409 RepID=A0A5B7JFL2_PORTR|nr:hypothetical protein [Portunus trituberculatus]